MAGHQAAIAAKDAIALLATGKDSDVMSKLLRLDTQPEWLTRAVDEPDSTDAELEIQLLGSDPLFHRKPPAEMFEDVDV